MSNPFRSWIAAGLIACGASAQAALAPGPDSFGYSVAATTNYSFINISNTGFRVLWFDDDTAVTANLGFTFNFYGSNYTSVSFNPNGLLTFGGLSTDYSNVDLTIRSPSNNLPCLAVLWDDWETQSASGNPDAVYYRTDGSVGNRQFIVQWNRVEPVEGAGTDTVTFEARLFEGSNRILFSYLDVIVSDDPAYSNGAFATVGIRDRNGQTNNRNLQWSYNQAVITNGQNLLFTQPNHLPIAVDDAASAGEDLPLTIHVLGNDTDTDGNLLAVIAVTQGAHGSVTINNNASVTYVPETNFNGNDSFTYTINDGQGGTATATVRVTVTPVNDPPLAGVDAYNLDEDDVLAVEAPGVLGNDSDPDGNLLVATLISGPAHGTLLFNIDGSFVYTPFGNYSGLDTFIYRAFDGSLVSSNTRVTLTINPLNDPPLALGATTTTLEETPVSITLQAADVENDPLTYAILEAPGNGVLSGLPPNLIYQPLTNFNGTDLFRFTVDDAHGGSATGTVFITVVPVNDPPVALPDSVEAHQDQPLEVPSSLLLANDSDVDGDILSITTVDASSGNGGTVGITNNNITYTPPAGFIGQDSFTYIINDAHGGSATGRVDVTVLPPVLRIRSIVRQAAGSYRIRFEGTSGATYTIEAATEWGSWQSIGTGSEIQPGQFEFEDSTGGLAQRFYRLVGL